MCENIIIQPKKKAKREFICMIFDEVFLLRERVGFQNSRRYTKAEVSVTHKVR